MGKVPGVRSVRVFMAETRPVPDPPQDRRSLGSAPGVSQHQVVHGPWSRAGASWLRTTDPAEKDGWVFTCVWLSGALGPSTT